MIQLVCCWFFSSVNRVDALRHQNASYSARRDFWALVDVVVVKSESVKGKEIMAIFILLLLLSISALFLPSSLISFLIQILLLTHRFFMLCEVISTCVALALSAHTRRPFNKVFFFLHAILDIPSSIVCSIRSLVGYLLWVFWVFCMSHQ